MNIQLHFLAIELTVKSRDWAYSYFLLLPGFTPLLLVIKEMDLPIERPS